MSVRDIELSNEADFPTVSEPVVISGVVHPLGSYGIGTGKVWAAQFFFETWRDANGVLHSGKLIIRREMPRDQLTEFVNQIHSYQILSVRVTLTGPNTADLIELLDKPVDDDDLIQRAAKLQEPQTYEHERFGTLTLDRRLDQYKGTVSWLGNKIQLNLEAAEDSTLESVLQTAIELWNHQQEWNQRVQDYAVEKLLELKNGVWLEDDEHEVSPEEFKSRMTLEAITVYPDGSFAFWHDDGDLFFSHTIQITGNLIDGPIDADIPG